jgi:hypothetical protein
MDETLRSLERDEHATASDEARWLRDRARRGLCDARRIRALARLGHPAARGALDRPLDKLAGSTLEVGDTVFIPAEEESSALAVLELAAEDRPALVALALAVCARDVLPTQELARRERSLDAVAEWIRCPCGAHRGQAWATAGTGDDRSLARLLRMMTLPDDRRVRIDAFDAVKGFLLRVDEELAAAVLRRALESLVMSEPLREGGEVLSLRLRSGGRRSYVVDVPRLTIGRRLQNRLVVDDPHVSREQCEIVRDPGGTYHVRHLGATNPTWLNGRSIEEAVLTSGSTLIVGDTTLDILIHARPLPPELEKVERDAAELRGTWLRWPEGPCRLALAADAGHRAASLALLRAGSANSVTVLSGGWDAIDRWRERLGESAIPWAMASARIASRVIERRVAPRSPLDEALSAAVEALEDWIRTPDASRAAVLSQVAERLEHLGATRLQTSGDWRRGHAVIIRANTDLAARAVACAARVPLDSDAFDELVELVRRLEWSSTTVVAIIERAVLAWALDLGARRPDLKSA